MKWCRGKGCNVGPSHVADVSDCLFCFFQEGYCLISLDLLGFSFTGGDEAGEDGRKNDGQKADGE